MATNTKNNDLKKSKKKSNEVKKLTRKEVRKQKRENKKQMKRAFFSKKSKDKFSENNQNRPPGNENYKYFGQCTVDKPSGDDNESIESNFSDSEVEAKIPMSLKQNDHKNNEKLKKAVNSNRPEAEEIHRRNVKQQKSLTEQARKQRIRQLKLENEEEDKFIAKLEKRLKLNKVKNKDRLMRKMFTEDGLDFALELCLNSDEQTKPNIKKSIKIDESALESEAEEYELSNYKKDVNDIECDTNENREDIYGRKRDKDGNVIPTSTEELNVYLPPHRRVVHTTNESDSKESEILELLHKRLKGLLNRLSESNLVKISTAIEELYAKNSRYNMNETLSTLLQESLINKVISNERMVQEHTVLLAYLHAHIGNEIGAYFLQMLIEKFDILLKEHQQAIATPNNQRQYNINNDIIYDKRLNNVILILCYMYVFRIFDHNLLLEIVDRLSEKLIEKTVECLLLLFQTIGFKLRKDEPLAFKRTLLSIQTKIAAISTCINEEGNERLKFMLDILNAIKNNNMNKVPKFDPMVHENLRKKLKSMLKNDKYVITLNIGIEDLLKANSVGKWWIIGSAWSGNTINPIESNDQVNKSGNISDKLLRLAKQHKMNTDERRKIFCILMSADDFMDAFEKILQLALKDQRSIAYVILYCCLNEKHPNPYYSHLALKFCNYNRKYQLAFQFASWDRINDIEALNKMQLKNFALFLYDLIIQGGLQLSVLKVIDFLQLDKHNYILMKKICTKLLLTNDEENLYQTFERLAKNTQLKQFKQSVRLFFQCTFLKNDKSTTPKVTDEKMDLMKRRIQYIDKLLAYVDL